MPIDELEVSSQTRKLLKAAGIATVGDLLAQSPKDLRRIKGIGTRRLGELTLVLERHGLRLAGEELQGH